MIRPEAAVDRSSCVSSRVLLVNPCVLESCSFALLESGVHLNCGRT
ncbi:MAG: hypothetical protein HC933_07340 [Pleurocapsa sp. SU_196_0]|nr:hypothetical protein [Pleurocapsa sp. SU_196_0]